ncbi:DUF4403 family protein [Altererythrobacter sp. Root672]|uniref:DUF4403 family protein n=1 Tax=Altererythrobacter sp. Root672 TaxID=1736584 RepID=UPI0006F30AE4|nr:DUF4403 family protein [Altererythrobacter sp. Root672]KRA84407.1 hypothetical protein ASD76_10655 [Altererythrobacter sp. Root672]
MRFTSILILLVALVLGGCNRQDSLPVPPRSTTVPQFESQNSTLVVPIELSLDDLQRALERKTPHTLWTIDKRNKKCVKGQRVKVFGERLKVTPDIDCRIVGQVTRGAVTLSGSGSRLTITMPIKAVVSARDVGGILKGETATASAKVRADVAFALDPNWNASARVNISYDWAEPPGIDFLGQRIEFAKRADKELAGVIAKLEQEVRQEVARANIKPVLTEAWKQGFTNIQLSSRNPPAWMRITPQGMGLAGYRVDGRKVILTVGVEAKTETFVGDEPPAPTPTPLPRQLANVQDVGLNFFMPVVADYAQLEPVVLRELRKLAAKGIKLEGVGSVNAQFNAVTIYATDDGRLAVGIDADVEPIGERTGVSFGKSKGKVWLTGLPISEADSQVVRIKDLQIFGQTDGMATNLLLRLASSESVLERIAGSLEEDFTKDYDKVLGKAQRAVAGRQEGRFLLSAQIDEVHHDTVQVTGAGLFTPVRVNGRGQIKLVPQKGAT